MTRDRPRSVDGSHLSTGSEADLLAGLWEEAPFARLPWDAPAEFKELVEDIENPKRVWSVYRASRRHNFQLLVQKYIVQLRDGCGSPACVTPTCFTCRKRVVGRAPIRRYNTTSARTLAVYLASQDNPESGLCPTLKTPKSPPAAVESLAFVPKHSNASRDEGRRPAFKTQNGHARRPGTPEDAQNGGSSRPGQVNSRKDSQARGRTRAGEPRVERTSHDVLPENPLFTVSEKTSNKDYRSFAANMFGTVAFKMMEWLTPAAMDEMSAKARKIQGDRSTGGRATSQPVHSHDSAQPSSPVSPRSKSAPVRAPGPLASTDTVNMADSRTEPEALGQCAERPASAQGTGENPTSQRRGPTPAAQASNTRRNSNARVRTPGSTKPKRKLSIDTFPQETMTEDIRPGLRSPRLPSISGEKTGRTLKTAASTIPRPISQLTTSGYFDGVSLEKMPPPKATDLRPRSNRSQSDGLQSGGLSPKRPVSSSTSQSSDGAANNETAPTFDPELESTYDTLLPQALSRLSAEAIDFFCDVLQEDDTSERHLLEPTTITKFHTKYAAQPKPLKRRQRSRNRTSVRLRLEWQMFVEQSVFYVLSDPQRVVRSFTQKGQLFDSQSLWYCMLRMTRVAPSLVFHCLWMAAEILFAPPKTVQALRSPTARLFPKQDETLSNSEAGHLMSICLHALIAAAPLVRNQRQLIEMSRIRSHGLSLSGGGAVAKQPAALCLQYDDAFSNDLAMRLARRLFAAIKTRRYFDELVECDVGSDGSSDQPDILAPLFAQLDFLSTDAAYILNFPFPERALHETRLPTLLLDWARAVLLNDWDGRTEIPADGPFGGALALIDAMYKKRHALLLGDAQFRSEYFAERIDEVNAPIAWLSFTSTRQKMHLLDFPYIFDHATLVSYFRSINFSRMNKAFHASSSLQDRLEDIAFPARLIINPQHKSLLHDLLRLATSKYLVLEIGRKTVLRDAFDQLWRREDRELMRPLKVHLGEGAGGEEGFDSGGVQQEFFRLAIAEALDPVYGAFAVDERTRMTWFTPGSVETEWRYELVGLLVSLAVHNGLTLPVTFPKALYRKLLGEPVTELHHIADGWPDLANGLTTLLEWDEKDGSVEDVFARTYEFSVEMFGQHVSREMNATDSWPQFPKHAWLDGAAAALAPAHADNPPDAPLVTNENRNAYVSDYIRYLTDVSVRPQFEAFERGFRACLHPKSLTLLTAPLLQSIVEGQQDIDVGDLRRYARYVGWDAGHRTVRDFWSIVRRYDDAMKRRLLEFVTASDRVPVGGVKNLQFVIQRNGEEEGDRGHLPTAYTCYGTLLLPEYRDKEVLKERLAMALENAQGFGFA